MSAVAALKEGRVNIKLNCSLAGIKFAYKPGDIYECSRAEADRHIAAGNGIELREEPQSEIADRLPAAKEKREGK